MDRDISDRISRLEIAISRLSWVAQINIALVVGVISYEICFESFPGAVREFLSWVMPAIAWFFTRKYLTDLRDPN